MNVTEGTKIVTFSCEAAQFIFMAVFRNRKEILCPGCNQQVKPCELGALFNNEAYHNSLPCLLTMSDQLKDPGPTIAHVVVQK